MDEVIMAQPSSFSIKLKQIMPSYMRETTALQTGRSWVRFPMVSLDFFH
jgi:hypothetical protein